MSLHENYSVERVPAAARLPFWGVALVHMGMLTALDQFMLGATLGHSMSYAHAFMAITAGSLIFFVATFGLGYAGMREGISGSLLARWCGFGRGGGFRAGQSAHRRQSPGMVWDTEFRLCQFAGSRPWPETRISLGRCAFRPYPDVYRCIRFQGAALCRPHSGPGIRHQRSVHFYRSAERSGHGGAFSPF